MNVRRMRFGWNNLGTGLNLEGLPWFGGGLGQFDLLPGLRFEVDRVIFPNYKDKWPCPAESSNRGSEVKRVGRDRASAAPVKDILKTGVLHSAINYLF